MATTSAGAFTAYRAFRLAFVKVKPSMTRPVAPVDGDADVPLLLGVHDRPLVLGGAEPKVVLLLGYFDLFLVGCAVGDDDNIPGIGAVDGLADALEIAFAILTNRDRPAVLNSFSLLSDEELSHVAVNAVGELTGGDGGGSLGLARGDGLVGLRRRRRGCGRRRRG